MQRTHIQLLQSMPVFGGISEFTMQFLLDRSGTITRSKGSFFFRENEPGSSMFVLERGRVGILKAWKGKEYLLRYLEAGDCFGEMALIDLYPRSASIKAVQDCTALQFSTETLYRLYEHDLEQFTLIFMNMGREISRRLRDADNRIFQHEVEQGTINGDFSAHLASHLV
jgi:CRP/FNR family cyclic AMP-dependent transcriptional regulator